MPCATSSRVLPGLAEDDTRNSLLTLARIWLTVATVDRTEGRGGLGLERMPAGAGEALRLARSGYLGEADDPWDDAAKALARADADMMLAAIDAG